MISLIYDNIWKVYEDGGRLPSVKQYELDFTQFFTNFEPVAISFIVDEDSLRLFYSMSEEQVKGLPSIFPEPEQPPPKFDKIGLIY